MSLPSAWVDRLFARMAVVYGSSWLRMWEGMDIETVKAAWGEELSRYQQNPDAIRYGLEHMPPDRPPTLLQFRELCNKRPDPVFKALPPPEIDREAAAKRASEIRLKVGGDVLNPKSWAYRLKGRDESGERLTIAQRDMYRAVVAQVEGA